MGLTSSLFFNFCSYDSGHTGPLIHQSSEFSIFVVFSSHPFASSSRPFGRPMFFRARIFKLVMKQRIDSKESIPPQVLVPFIEAKTGHYKLKQRRYFEGLAQCAGVQIFM